MLTVGLDARGFQRPPGFVTDLAAQYDFATCQFPDSYIECTFAVSASVTAFAIRYRLAVTDETHTCGRRFVDQELAGMTEVFVDHAAALGGDCNQHRTCYFFLLDALDADQLHLGFLGESFAFQFLVDGGMHLGAHLHRLGIVDVHLLDLVHGEFRAAVFAQQSDRIGTALATVAHHVHVARAGILQRLQLVMSRSALAGEAVVGAVLGFGDQRHHVVQESALGFHDLRDFSQMLIVDAGDHHRIHLDQNALGDQHLQPLLLLLDQDGGAFASLDALVLPEDPRIDHRTHVGIDAVDGDGYMVDVVLRQFLYLIG